MLLAVQLSIDLLLWSFYWRQNIPHTRHMRKGKQLGWDFPHPLPLRDDNHHKFPRHNVKQTYNSTTQFWCSTYFYCSSALPSSSGSLSMGQEMLRRYNRLSCMRGIGKMELTPMTQSVYNNNKTVGKSTCVQVRITFAVWRTAHIYYAYGTIICGVGIHISRYQYT